jgi:hypothetical protein
MLQVRESKDTIDTFFQMDIFTEETKDRVRNADILFLPEIGVIDGIEKAFRPETKTFLKFALANNSNNYSIELFENAGEENVLNFHSLDIYLPVIYLRNDNLLNDIVDLVCGFVEYKVKHGRNNEPVVNLIIKVEHNEICKVYTYKGLMEVLKESFVAHKE